MIYLLIANIAMIISFLLYHLCFRKLTFFQWNRFYLVSTVLLALLIPIGLYIDLSSFVETSDFIPVINISEVIDLPMVIYVDKSIYLKDFLIPLYYTGVAISILYLVYRLVMVKQLFNKRFEHLSFSFFNKIFLGKNIKHEKTILHHEQVHVDQGHSYDIMLLEFVKILNWFNPIVYYISKELKFQHECIADEICSEDKVAYAELLVANAMRVDKSFLVQEFSNHSFLKKRIMMLFKNKSSNKKKLLYISTIPVLLVIVGSTVVFNTSRAQAVVSAVENQFLDVKLTDKVEEKVLDTSLESETELPDALASSDFNAIESERDTLKWGGDELFESVEVLPEPKGGMAAFRKWIADNFKYPQAAIDTEVRGTIQTSFVVEKDGTLSNIKLIKDLGFGTGMAAVRLLENAPKWSPGIQKGKKVRVTYNLPIRLDLQSEDGVKRAEPELGYFGLQSWLSDRFVAPRMLTEADVDPFIYASFIIMPDGRYEHFFVKTDLDKSFSEKIINLLKESKWKVSETNGIKDKSRASIILKLDRNGKILKNYERVEVTPEPKGGMSALHGYLQSNLQYPEGLSKEVNNFNSIKFMIDKEGKVNFLSDGGKIVSENVPDMREDVMKLMKAYGNWSPGILDGQKVEVSYSLIVHFDKGKITTSMRGGDFNKASLRSN